MAAAAWLILEYVIALLASNTVVSGQQVSSGTDSHPGYRENLQNLAAKCTTWQQSCDRELNCADKKKQAQVSHYTRRINRINVIMLKRIDLNHESITEQ